MNDGPAATPATGKKTLWAWAVGLCSASGCSSPGRGRGPRSRRRCCGSATKSRPGATPLYPYEAGLVWGTFALETILAVILATALGIPAATRVALGKRPRRPQSRRHRPSGRPWLTLVVCRPDWPHALLALALFRLFDITKPWPIRKLEALPGGWGVLLGDLAAGFFGLVVLLVIQHWCRVHV